MLIRLFIIIYVLLISLPSLAQINLVKIEYSMMEDNIYQVKLTLDQQTSFNVLSLSNPDRVAIDLYNSKFNVGRNDDSLDGRFLKTIRKANKNNSDLRVILELASQAEFKEAFSSLKNGSFSIIAKFKNDNLPKIVTLPKAVKKSSPPKKMVIMIDPGHGGVDKGAVGPTHKVIEKKITLSYALALKKELSKYPQYQVFLTRDKDVAITRDIRRAKARKVKADLFISIHADSNPDASLKGASIYTLSQEGYEQESTALADRDNNNNILKNDKLLKQNESIANVLIDMVYQDSQNSSKKLAKITTEELSKEVQMLEKSHRSAGLRVLKIADIPAILVELGYLSNPGEEKLLNSQEYKKRFVHALVQSINRYNLN